MRCIVRGRNEYFAGPIYSKWLIGNGGVWPQPIVVRFLTDPLGTVRAAKQGV